MTQTYNSPGIAQTERHRTIFNSAQRWIEKNKTTRLIARVKERLINQLDPNLVLFTGFADLFDSFLPILREV